VGGVSGLNDVKLKDKVAGARVRSVWIGYSVSPPQSRGRSFAPRGRWRTDERFVSRLIEAVEALWGRLEAALFAVVAPTWYTKVWKATWLGSSRDC
jgi:hypothetical protein